VKSSCIGLSYVQYKKWNCVEFNRLFYNKLRVTEKEIFRCYWREFFEVLRLDYVTVQS
jgi:hypothetical protein